MKKYTVFVDDNFHYMDESERYKFREFDSCEEAVNACKKIVDEYFENIQGKKTFKDLWDGYTSFGEDPYIVSDDNECSFSAWDYARMRCKELSSKDK